MRSKTVLCTIIDKDKTLTLNHKSSDKFPLNIAMEEIHKQGSNTENILIAHVLKKHH